MLLKFVVAILALLAVNVSLADDEVVSGPTKESKQFDFWLGDWKVVNRRINGNNIWKQFGIAKAEIHSALDGKVIIEQWTGQGDYVLRGFSLRTYDEEEKTLGGRVELA